jgi:hypothetical protein
VAGQGIHNQDDQMSDSQPVVPRVTKGLVVGKTAHQIFAKTDTVLVDGMCGGCVCTAASAEVCGVLEGIVHTSHAVELIRNAAVFVESGDIRRYATLMVTACTTALPCLACLQLYLFRCFVGWLVVICVCCCCWINFDSFIFMGRFGCVNC